MEDAATAGASRSSRRSKDSRVLFRRGLGPGCLKVPFHSDFLLWRMTTPIPIDGKISVRADLRLRFASEDSEGSSPARQPEGPGRYGDHKELLRRVGRLEGLGEILRWIAGPSRPTGTASEPGVRRYGPQVGPT